MLLSTTNDPSKADGEPRRRHCGDPFLSVFEGSCGLVQMSGCNAPDRSSTRQGTQVELETRDWQPDRQPSGRIHSRLALAIVVAALVVALAAAGLALANRGGSTIGTGVVVI